MAQRRRKTKLGPFGVQLRETPLSREPLKDLNLLNVSYASTINGENDMDTSSFIINSKKPFNGKKRANLNLTDVSILSSEGIVDQNESTNSSMFIAPKKPFGTKRKPNLSLAEISFSSKNENSEMMQSPRRKRQSPRLQNKSINDHEENDSPSRTGTLEKPVLPSSLTPKTKAVQNVDVTLEGSLLKNPKKLFAKKKRNMSMSEISCTSSLSDNNKELNSSTSSSLIAPRRGFKKRNKRNLSVDEISYSSLADNNEETTDTSSLNNVFSKPFKKKKRTGETSLDVSYRSLDSEKENSRELSLRKRVLQKKVKEMALAELSFEESQISSSSDSVEEEKSSLNESLDPSEREESIAESITRKEDSIEEENEENLSIIDENHESEVEDVANQMNNSENKEPHEQSHGETDDISSKENEAESLQIEENDVEMRESEMENFSGEANEIENFEMESNEVDVSSQKENESRKIDQESFDTELENTVPVEHTESFGTDEPEEQLNPEESLKEKTLTSSSSSIVRDCQSITPKCPPFQSNVAMRRLTDVDTSYHNSYENSVSTISANMQRSLTNGTPRLGLFKNCKRNLSLAVVSFEESGASAEESKEISTVSSSSEEEEDEEKEKESSLEEEEEEEESKEESSSLEEEEEIQVEEESLTQEVPEDLHEMEETENENELPAEGDAEEEKEEEEVGRSSQYNILIENPLIPAESAHEISDYSNHYESCNVSIENRTVLPVDRLLMDPGTCENTSDDFEKRMEEIIAKAKQNAATMIAMTNPQSYLKLLSQNEKKKTSYIKKVVAPESRKRRPRPKLYKPVCWANKRLYTFLINKLEPEFGLECNLEAEKVVKELYDTTRLVGKKKEFQSAAVSRLKVRLATWKIVRTTNDFNYFVRSFLPKEFEYKVIPALQPGTNIIWPPRDTNKKDSDPIIG